MTAATTTLDSVSIEIPADLDTPVTAFLKLRKLGADILLESVEKGERVGRYSIIGVGALGRVESDGKKAILSLRGETRTVEHSPAFGPLDAVKSLMDAIEPGEIDPDIPFLASAVGYVSYDAVRSFEKLRTANRDPGPFPLLIMQVPRSVVVFDHVRRKVTLATLTEPDEKEEALGRLGSLAEAFHSPLPQNINRGPGCSGNRPVPNVTKKEFENMVRAAGEHIAAGDIFQVVLSQRFDGETAADPFQVYRALRMLNPSPYTFFLDTGEFHLVGSSPEAMVTLKAGTASVRPIAGTRRRGETVEEDGRLAEELLADAKERAEHVMLVDLGRNDLGRVCEFGTVKVGELMKVEYYSHVMHMVSSVTGKLAAGSDMFDLFRSAFPAGTVSGAPKIRAMEIIDELEPQARGPYAGAVGYFDLRGDMDFCITIRTVVMRDGKYSVQAGAGVVHDSTPEREHAETIEKAGALVRAIQMAEEGF